jgi:hypothetical protein
MNPELAGIYGTGGHEKVASEDGLQINTLSDLALYIIAEQMGGELAQIPDDTDRFEKVASVHGPLLEEFASFDRAGRAMAHHEFTEMEKQAASGNWEPLNQFFADVMPEAEENPELEALAAVEAEIARRLGQ